jgi:hypothetical protein
MTNTEWDVARPGTECSRCARALAVGEEHWSVLLDDGGVRHLRREVCTACWNGAAEPGAVAVWKTRVPRRDAAKRRLVGDDVLLNFFERCAGSDDPDKRNFRFVLGLMLMRKRLLKYESAEIRPDGSEVWTLRAPSGGEPVEVVNPKLAEEQIDQVSAQVTAMLEAEG